MITIQPLQPNWGNVLGQLRLNSALEGFYRDVSGFASLVADLRGRSEKNWNKTVTDYLVDSSKVTLIAFDNQMPCGMIMCHLEQSRSTSVFDLIWVNSDCRRKGTGSLLLRAATKWSGQQGASTIETWVLEENRASVALHERAGFIMLNKWRSDTSSSETQAQCFTLNREQITATLSAPMAQHIAPDIA